MECVIIGDNVKFKLTCSEITGNDEKITLINSSIDYSGFVYNISLYYKEEKYYKVILRGKRYISSLLSNLIIYNMD